MKRTIVVLGLSTVALAAPARAHHEAIFGPQSSLVLSAPSFASVQTFSRQLGTAGARTQESTMLLSAGVTPLRSVPAVGEPRAADVQHRHAGRRCGSRRGLEDAILGVRYRLDLTGLQERFGKDGNYLMGMAAVEVPTGSVDHAAFRGPLDGMVAATAGIERGPLSWIGYAFYRGHGTRLRRRARRRQPVSGRRHGLHALRRSGARAAGQLAARAVVRDLRAQHRRTARRCRTAVARGLYLHPTVVWGPGGRMLLFGTTSLPAFEDYRNTRRQQPLARGRRHHLPAS